MNILQVLSVTLLVFSCVITFSQGEWGESNTADAIIRIRLVCPSTPSREPSTDPTFPPNQPLTDPVIEPTPSSPQPLTEPPAESTSPPFQPSAESKSTLASSQPSPSLSTQPSPPCPTLPSPSHSLQPPPPHSHQPFPSNSHQPSPPCSTVPSHSPQPPPPHSHQPFPSNSHQPSPPCSTVPSHSPQPPPPHSHKPFPSNSHQPSPPGSNQSPPLQPFQPSPPCSPQSSSSSTLQPSTSCPLNSDYRQPIVTMTRFESESSLGSLSRWYFPQPPSNFQTIIEYAINGDNVSFSCESEPLETIQNHDQMMSSLRGLCALELPLTNDLEVYAIKFNINNEVKYSNYSAVNKNQWMYDSKELLGDLLLSELVIPGTHESAAYPALGVRSSFGGPEDIQHRILHQSVAIDKQLHEGIRYLDLRPARFGEGRTREYVLMNGFQERVSLSLVAEQITTFIENSLEIVIVSFRDFSRGFNYKTDHKIFINQLKELFGRHAYTYRSITPKLNDIWRSNRRLILHYHDSMCTFRNFLWPAIPQIEKKFGYPENEASYKQQNRRQTLQAVIPQLLPEGQDQRNAVDDLSMAIFDWATGIGRSDVNIIAVDYYDRTGVVDIARQLNQERAREKACTKSNKPNIGFFGWHKN